MDDYIRFNVIIPTRERAEVLVHCLRTLVAQDYPNLKIIVSDNFSEDHTKAVVDSFADDRIQYVNTGRRVSMSHNWEFGLSHATDGWVMFLGDDDGLYPWALRALNDLIHTHDVEAISPNAGFYQWPGSFPDSPQGQLTTPTTAGFAEKNSRAELKRALAGQVTYRDLPCIYIGGAAALALINRARDPNGRFFCSRIPDVYSAVALSAATTKYLSVGMPIAIVGISRHSTGTALMSAQAGKEDAPIAQFIAEENIPFHETLVFGTSLHVMVYESYLQSWHLHQGALGIALADQLGVAMNTVSLARLPKVREECRLIAERNGLPFVDCEMGWRLGLRSLLTVMKNEYQSYKIVPAPLGIMNVHDATVASAAVYEIIRKPLFRYLVFLPQTLNILRWMIRKLTNKVALMLPRPR